MDPYTVTIAICVIAVAAVAVLVYSYLRQQNNIKVMLDALKAEKVDPHMWVIPCGREKVILSYTPVGRYNASQVSLSLKGDFRGNCVIRKETRLDKWSKRVGIDREIQIMDPEIGGRYYFECEDDDLVRSLIQQPAAKSFLKQALEMFTRIEINENTCSLIRSPGDLMSYNSQQLAEVAGRLVEFVRCLPQAASSPVPSTPATAVFEARDSLWTGIAFGSLFVGVLYWSWGGLELYRPVAPWRVFIASLWVSLPLVLLFAFRAISQLRQHATSAQVLMKVLGLGGTGLVVCVWAGMTLLNGFLDKSQPVSHNVYVVSKHVSTSGSKTGNKYYLTVNPWKEGQLLCDLRVSRSTYDGTRVSTPCFVWTKNGFWGYEWISRYSCSP